MTGFLSAGGVTHLQTLCTSRATSFHPPTVGVPLLSLAREKEPREGRPKVRALRVRAGLRAFVDGPSMDRQRTDRLPCRSPYGICPGPAPRTTAIDRPVTITPSGSRQAGIYPARITSEVHSDAAARPWIPGRRPGGRNFSGDTALRCHPFADAPRPASRMW